MDNDMKIVTPTLEAIYSILFTLEAWWPFLELYCAVAFPPHSPLWRCTCCTPRLVQRKDQQGSRGSQCANNRVFLHLVLLALCLGWFNGSFCSSLEALNKSKELLVKSQETSESSKYC